MHHVSLLYPRYDVIYVRLYSLTVSLTVEVLFEEPQQAADVHRRVTGKQCKEREGAVRNDEVKPSPLWHLSILL